MPTYDQATRHPGLTAPAVNLAAAFTRNIRGPKGRRGRVIGMKAQVTTSIAGAVLPIATLTTTMPPIQASPKATPPAAQTVVWSYTFPATVAPAGLSSDNQPSANIRDANNLLQILPADADVVFTIVPASGAGAAGVADLEFEIDWF